MSQVYIGLGSNLQQPQIQLARAVEVLSNQPQIDLVRLSSFYQSKALVQENSPEQPDYINAVACITTDLQPLQLLQLLNTIENQQGRIRTEKWSARTLDLDILLFDDKIISEPQLIVPHPQMLVRNFVVFPLYEINPAIHIPAKGALKKYYLQLDRSGLKQLQANREFDVAL